MTNISAIHQYQNQAAFELLNQVGFNPNSLERVEGVKLDLTDTDDDVVMLNGDNIEVNAKEGNNTVMLYGDNNKITAGNGNNSIALGGTNSSAQTGLGDDSIYIEGTNIDVTSAGGDNEVRIYGENNSLTSGDGKNQIGMIGNSNAISLGDGMQKIAFWGNNNNITMGDGNSSVMTIDYALKTNAKLWGDLESPWIEELDHFNTSEKVNSNVVYDYSHCTNPIYAALSDEDKAFAETVDMMELKDGKAKYVVAANPDGIPTIYVYSYTYECVAYYYPQGHEGEQEFKTIIHNVAETETAYEKYDDYEMNYFKNFIVDGVTGNNIQFGNGDNTLKWTLQDGNFNIEMGTANTGHTLEQQQSYTFAEDSNHPFLKYEVVSKKFYTVVAE